MVQGWNMLRQCCCSGTTKSFSGLFCSKILFFGRQVRTAAGVVQDILELEMCPRQDFSSREPPPDLAQLEVRCQCVVPTFTLLLSAFG